MRWTAALVLCLGSLALHAHPGHAHIPGDHHSTVFEYAAIAAFGLLAIWLLSRRRERRARQRD